MIEIIKAILYGIVEGITEWIPVSSTGHLILLNDIIPMNVSPEFWELFLVVIQLGAIMAVVIYFWHKIWPFNTKVKNKPFIRYDVMNLWVKIVVACIPAVIVGLLFDDWIEEHLYSSTVVAIMLILLGIAFIIVENKNKKESIPPRVTSLRELTYRDAIIVGLFQVIAAVLPGTSRSGSTIIGGLIIGIERTVAAEFTFFLAIPVMFGASFLKLLKFGFNYLPIEILLLVIGCVTAFVVSLGCIKFLMGYIKKNDFKIFGYYRIILGVIVLVYFTVKSFLAQ
ncbi:MAG: undecaprenyl-diphosphate phosphatase [Firmicutes bacterium]|nr:undecaprenyl-diphosphate phosphatase [Bacillota bacterium]